MDAIIERVNFCLMGYVRLLTCQIFYSQFNGEINFVVITNVFFFFLHYIVLIMKIAIKYNIGNWLIKYRRCFVQFVFSIQTVTGSKIISSNSNPSVYDGLVELHLFYELNLTPLTTGQYSSSSNIGLRI